MYKKSDKRGFTMAEMLVCLTIISVIATILVPTLGRIKPHKEKTMFKKTYQIAERVIYELVNDPELYPTTDINAGFDNVKEVEYNGEKYGAKLDLAASCGQYEEGTPAYNTCANNAQATSDSKGREKFCQLFGLKVNTLENVARCDMDPDFVIKDFKQYRDLVGMTNLVYDKYKPTFTTTDGVEWYLPCTNFEPDQKKLYHPIFVDVNGPKPPNHSDDYINEPSTPVDKCTDDMQAQIDRFVILVRADGKMEVPGVCARAYLQDMSLMHKAK